MSLSGAREHGLLLLRRTYPKPLAVSYAYIVGFNVVYVTKAEVDARIA